MEVRPGQTPAHSQPLIANTTMRDTIRSHATQSPHNRKSGSLSATTPQDPCQNLVLVNKASARKIEAFLPGPLQLPHQEVEEMAALGGRKMARLLLQGHLDLGSAPARRLRRAVP